MPFDAAIADELLPKKFNYPFDYVPHQLAILASEKLQQYLDTQQDWKHNFGLKSNVDGAIIGKMFGVLVVKTVQNELGYLWAFSGKLANSNTLPYFVPPVFDMLQDNSFLTKGMLELKVFGLEIKKLELENTINSDAKILIVKELRKRKSIELQEKLFEEYHFLNQLREVKSLKTIFKEELNKNPPSAAGECAAPKLLQYAFRNGMKPITMAEFWWGLSPKSSKWKHKHFYPACQEKCAPILNFMLNGIEMEENRTILTQ